MLEIPCTLINHTIGTIRASFRKTVYTNVSLVDNQNLETSVNVAYEDNFSIISGT